MAKDNYSYKRYTRELAKKKKKEEKEKRRLNKKNAQSNNEIKTPTTGTEV